MAGQTTISTDEYSNFLRSGALLTLPRDQFKLILGPFKPILIDFSAISLQDSTEIFIYKPDFWDFLENKKYQIQLFKGKKEFILSKSELFEMASNYSTNNNLLSFKWQSEDWKDFEQQFTWSQEQFQSKNLEKVVPITVHRAQGQFLISSLNEVLKKVLQSTAFGYIYGFWQDGAGFLGLTPELIGQWNSSQQIYETMALAGTQKNSENIECKMLENHKLMKEHKIVVEDIKQALSTIISKIQISEINVLKLNLFSHLQTKIQTQVKDISEAMDIVQGIHPSAALGLFPRKKEHFQKLSKFNLQKIRKNFAAPFGFINQKSLNMVAAIRNFYFTPDEITIFSGCGIIRESVLEDEIEELRQKRLSVQKMMGFSL